jgi:hypothetical protein
MNQLASFTRLSTLCLRYIRSVLRIFCYIQLYRYKNRQLKFNGDSIIMLLCLNVSNYWSFTNEKQQKIRIKQTYTLDFVQLKIFDVRFFPLKRSSYLSSMFYQSLFKNGSGVKRNKLIILLYPFIILSIIDLRDKLCACRFF